MNGFIIGEGRVENKAGMMSREKQARQMYQL